MFFIQRYRFLTIDQFARAGGVANRSTASDQLRFMERHGLLSHFGNTGLAGHGKTPKVYFLTRKGWDILTAEGGIPTELIGSYKRVHVEAAWSPQMYHRLRTVDLMIAAEIAVRERPHLSMVKTFLEYRMVKRARGLIERETADYVADERVSENRIIPDAAFIIENVETTKRALFFVEMDMATETIVNRITRDKRVTIYNKMLQYDRYLQSLRYNETYASLGEFRFFTLLFVTVQTERLENIRRSAQNLPDNLSQYYRFATYERAMQDFLGPIWVSRDPTDPNVYPLVRGAS